MRTISFRNRRNKPHPNNFTIDWTLWLTAGITSGRAPRPVLFFINRNAEALFRRFIEAGGNRELIQFLAWPNDLEHLCGWLRLWKPTLVVFHRDTGALRPVTIRGRCATRRAQSRLAWSAQIAGPRR